MEKPKSVRLEPKTSRPVDAYPKQGDMLGSETYVDAFSRALGLKPTPTAFGEKVRDV
jgi:hypothetical protein